MLSVAMSRLCLVHQVQHRWRLLHLHPRRAASSSPATGEQEVKSQVQSTLGFSPECDTWKKEVWDLSEELLPSECQFSPTGEHMGCVTDLRSLTKLVRHVIASLSC